MTAICSRLRHIIPQYLESKLIPGRRYFSRQKPISVSAHVLEMMNSNNHLTPVEKGYKFLVDSCNARRCFQPIVSKYSDFQVSTPSPFPEIFDTALILDLLYKKTFDLVTVETCLRYLKENQGSNKLFTFFENHTLLPQDVDDTALATLNLMRYQRISHQDAMLVADAILANVDEDGVIQTYFPPYGGRQSRIDSSVCANALRLIHELGRGEEALKTENHLYLVLDKMKPSTHNEGNLYYGNQAFFYFMLEAIKASQALRKRFSGIFAERVTSAIGSSESPIDLASRVMVTTELKLSNYMEIDKLLHLQQPEGSWPIDVTYTGSRKNLYWGSKKVSTAFALSALDEKMTMHLIQRMYSLPVLSLGLVVVNGYLRYTKDFSPFSCKQAIVITHTETHAAQKSKFYDREKTSLNNSLTEKGIQEALDIAKKIKQNISNSKTIIFYGDNTRTLETAKIIRTAFRDSNFQCASWLNEINCSGWLGRDIDEIFKTSFAANAMFLRSSCLASAPNGENFLEYLNSVYEGLLQLQERQDGKSITLLCTSRVTLVAIKILMQRDIVYDSQNNIDWSLMAKQLGTGKVFIF